MRQEMICRNKFITAQKLFIDISSFTLQYIYSFYQNSSVWLDTQDARSQDRNPSNFTLD